MSELSSRVQHLPIDFVGRPVPEHLPRPIVNRAVGPFDHLVADLREVRPFGKNSRGGPLAFSSAPFSQGRCAWERQDWVPPSRAPASALLANSLPRSGAAVSNRPARQGRDQGVNTPPDRTARPTGITRQVPPSMSRRALPAEACISAMRSRPSASRCVWRRISPSLRRWPRQPAS